MCELAAGVGAILFSSIRVRCPYLAATLAACGRISFDPQLDARTADATVDVATVGPDLCGIPFGQWTLAPPQPIDDINSLLIAQNPGNGDQDEFDPVFSEDGLSLYFTSDQSGAFQVWVATRSSLTSAWSTVVLANADVNAAPNSIFGFQPLASLQRAIIAAPYTGSIGGTDLWLGTQIGADWNWSPTSLSTTDGDGDARMTADGTIVYFPRGTGDARDIYRASRSSLSTDFGAPTLVPELDSPLSDSAPAPARDGIFIVRNTNSTTYDDDLWYAANDGAGGFESYPLDALNTTAFDGEPAVLETPDGCQLVFVSTRAGGPYNLYKTTVAR